MRAEPLDDQKPKMLLCLGCASLYPDSGDDPITCVRCGHSMERARYNRIAEYAREAARYGHQYRLRYEADGTGTKYCLAPDEVLSFVAIAALSGIIGSAAYDLVKAVAAKIVQACRAERLTTHDDPSDPARIEELLASIRSYLNGMPEASEEIRAECRKEKLIDAYSQATAAWLFESPRTRTGPPSEEEMKEEIKGALLEAQAELAARETPSASDFDDCWRQITTANRD